MTPLPTRPRATTRASGGTEEGLKDVTEGTKSGELVASAVVALTLFGVTEHLVGVGDELKPILGTLLLIHIRVEFTGKLAIGLANVLGTRFSRDAEDFVVVSAHEFFSSVDWGPPRMPDR